MLIAVSAVSIRYSMAIRILSDQGNTHGSLVGSSVSVCTVCGHCHHIDNAHSVT